MLTPYFLDPDWASINRGVLICDECCSVHRSLGRHISQVRHLRLAPWNQSLLSVRCFFFYMMNILNRVWNQTVYFSIYPFYLHKQCNILKFIPLVMFFYRKAFAEFLNFWLILRDPKVFFSKIARKVMWLIAYTHLKYFKQWIYWHLYLFTSLNKKKM